MLFSPFTNSALSFANRIAMAPMTRCRCDHRDAIPNAMVVEYYRQRASAGLLISEGVPVSDQARGYPNTAALWNDAQAEGWLKVTNAVHAAGGKIFAQLWHCGRVSHSRLHADGSRPVGPTEQAAKLKAKILEQGEIVEVDCEAPQAMSVAEIKQVIADFARSARLAKEAGFDGVEIHGANGYLFDQFRCPLLNTRDDAYGGSLAKRYRLLLEVVDAVAAEIDPARICVRQSPLGLANDMLADPEPLVTYPYIATELAQRGVGFLHIYDQSANWIHHADDALLPALRAAFSGAIIACGGFKREQGEAILARQHADLIAIGKPFIANPDLVGRLQKGQELARWDASVFYQGGEKGYLDYPTAA